jgi:hypothetical protein
MVLVRRKERAVHSGSGISSNERGASVSKALKKKPFSSAVFLMICCLSTAGLLLRPPFQPQSQSQVQPLLRRKKSRSQVQPLLKSNLISSSLPPLLRVDFTAEGTIFDDMIFRYGPIEMSSDDNDYNSTLCDVSISSSVIITNYTARAVANLSEYIIMDKIPVLLQTNSSQLPFATCQFKNYAFSAHFPHFMQQFFRCWSFWQHHSDKIAVFLTTRKKSNHYRRAMVRPFTSGLMKVLPQMGVQVMEAAKTPQAKEGFHHVNDISSVSCTIIGPLNFPNDTSYQAASTNDMAVLRSRALSALSLNSTASSSGCHRTALATASNTRVPRIALVNRRSNRRLMNTQEILEDLQSHFDLPYNIPEMLFEGKSFDFQVQALSTIDILITPHGAQETGLVFLPKCGGVLEIIPGGYFYPNFFGTLAASAGLEHAFLYLGKDVSYHYYNTTVRNSAMCPPLPSIRKAVAGLMDRWHLCCSRLLE